MSQIFISYSRRDLEIVDSIVEKIENAAISVWIDRDDIRAGKTWRVQIVEAIATCDAFVLMLSSNSAVSDNVRKEIDLAQDSGRAVFIVRLNPVELPADMQYQLVGLQYIDLQMLGIDAGANQLIDTLEEHLTTWKPPEDRTVRQAELVFRGRDPAEFGAKKQEQTLGLISALTKTPQSQLDIANLAAGGVHVFVDMPAAAAFELKTRALNRDSRLQQFGVKSMRLAGDKQYVNVSLGILTATATIGYLNMLWMSMPSLFPSLFGVAVGKVIVITSVVVVTTAASVAASADGIHMPNPIITTTPTKNTFTPTPHHPISGEGQTTPFFTSTPAEINTLTSASGQAIPPISIPPSGGIIPPPASPTKSSPTMPASLAPAHPPTSIPSPTATSTMTSTEPPPVSIPISQIVSIECGSGLALNVHIRITNDAGISSYSVWSTWGGGGQIDRTFSAPLPTVVDEVVVHEHAIPDPVDRNHQVGLKVTTPNNSQPIFTYAFEPNGRCPGHYQPPSLATSTPTDTPQPTSSTPIAQIVSIECGSGLALNVHVRITNGAGISSYSVWSTWGGGGEIDRTFSAPLPLVIDEVVVHEHAILDPVDRLHQVGLQVTTPDSSQPIFTYALEPGGRCPGHYQASPTMTSTPTDASPASLSTLQVTEASLQADPVDYAGTCPVRITFSGSVSVDGSGTVSYKFLRSDGASAPTQTLTFDGPGSQNVSTTWDLGGAGFTYSGWVQIQILDPQPLISNQASFNIQCQ